MKDLTLVFETDLLGHRLEYIHHYYMGAIKNSQMEYLFYVPDIFKELKGKYEWPQAQNVKFAFLTNEQEKSYANKSPLLYCYNISKLLNKIVRQVKPDKVLLTTLITYIPFINFMLPKYVKVRGIIYNIYFYDSRSMSFLRLLFEKLRHIFISSSNLVESAYILNDKDACKLLNDKYKTTKYKYLVDPVPNVDPEKIKGLRMELDIPAGNKVYLHFGAMDKRKGTIEFLKAISLLSEHESKNKTFIFAGKILDEIKDEFYQIANTIIDKLDIKIYDSFCDYEFLYSLCKTCDIIVAPYKITSNSSGVLGYAALFNKSVIGPSSGLVGRIIKDNNLGLVLNECTPIHIKNAILQKKIIGENNYSKTHRIVDFTNQILNM